MQEFEGQAFSSDELVMMFRSHNSLWAYSVYIIYILVLSTLIGMTYQLKDLLGPEMFRQITMGEYSTPKEEKRIFMFLDLKGSTAHAERLGHVRYSNLIRDCFNQMTDCIVAHKAEVYQYVGDEIVLTWPFANGIQNSNCIEIFSSIKKVFATNKEYYQNRYGCVPEFKGGVSGGLVTGVEVGLVKRELAFHGDVLNIGSRLEALCKELDKELLVSTDLVCFLGKDGFCSMGTFELKGKSVRQEVFALA
ncbi:adenylate/guanylate cyclase domain-containing protein [Fulvitalea axinellae]